MLSERKEVDYLPTPLIEVLAALRADSNQEEMELPVLVI